MFWVKTIQIFKISWPAILIKKTSIYVLMSMNIFLGNGMANCVKYSYSRLGKKERKK